ncbi:hypothetical protein SVAN01_09577, partial [Stagonosporopsis vannaccii]
MEQNDSKGVLGQEASGAPNVARKEKACCTILVFWQDQRREGALAFGGCPAEPGSEALRQACQEPQRSHSAWARAGQREREDGMRAVRSEGAVGAATDAHCRSGISHSLLRGSPLPARCPLPAARCLLPRHHLAHDLTAGAHCPRPPPPPLALSSPGSRGRQHQRPAPSTQHPHHHHHPAPAPRPRRRLARTRTLASHAPSPSPPPYAGVKAASLMSVTTVHESQMMSPYAAEREPSTAGDAPNFSHPHPHTPKGLPHRTPSEKSLPLRERAPNASKMNGSAKQQQQPPPPPMAALPNGHARPA